MLLGTDPQLLETAAVPFSSIRAVLSFRGIGFDLPARMADSRYLAGRYRQIFGNNADDIAALSPITHLELPNSPGFMLLASPEDRESMRDTQTMLAALQTAAVPVQYSELPEPRIAARRTLYMVETDGSGKDVIPFLRAQFAPRTDPGTAHESLKPPE